MLRNRVVAMILTASLLAGLPLTAQGSSPIQPEQQPAAVSAGPTVSTSAAPLSANEAARYAQRQDAATQTGALAQKGMGSGNDSIWPIIGVVAGTAIIVGLIVAATGA